MSSSLVIKVKHGEMLRRFNACIVYGKLDLDIDRLRKKIIRLFNFAPDANFILTYTDEDGDVITLVDEGDLHDIMKQSLNPLRMTVKLNRSIHQKISLGTPQLPFPNLNTSANINEIVKSIPESFSEALSKLPIELASKAVYSAIAELVECFTKTRGFYMNPLAKVQASTSSTGRKDTSESESCKNNKSTRKETHDYTFKESGNSKNDRHTSDVGLKSYGSVQNSNLANSSISAQNSKVVAKIHKKRDFSEKYPGADPPRLNSQFIESSGSDLHEIILAPSTQFSKIWRIINNGLDAWPKGTRLVWVEGGKFSNKLYVELEIPKDGLPVGNELQVSVSFVAPQLPGSHVSYWSLASPSGQHFGQRVGVFIQVVPFQNDLPLNPTKQVVPFQNDLPLNNSKGIIDLNFPPESKETGDELARSALGPMNVEEQRKTQKYNRVMVETALRVPSPSPSTKRDNGNGDVEQTLLKELDDMGFKQVDLNKEVLRLNKFDLEQTVVDLCCGFELDPKLKKLQNLGFTDMEKNRKLLLKHNGNMFTMIWELTS